jgi:pimeloyl-ACP methyl ester carboxylesterase
LIWRHWIDALSTGHRLVRYDARGSGLSSWEVPELSLDLWVSDLEAVVDAQGHDRFALLGVSQGAAVAVRYAARHPDRVGQLVLYGGYVQGPYRRARSAEGQRAALLMAEVAELGWGTADAALRQVFTARFMPNGTRAQWDAFNELQRRSTTPANAAAYIRAVGDIDVEEDARRVQAPTLVLHARDDRMPPVAQGRLLATLIPDSRFVTLDSSNHILLVDEPAWPRFVEEVEDFLGDDAGQAQRRRTP